MVDQVTVQKQVVVQEGKLKDFCNKVWMKLGVPVRDAKITTDVLVLADLRGIESHGVARLPRYYADLKNGWTKPADQSKIVKETKATAMIDGGQSLGQVVGHKGMELAIKKAKETAVGIVSVRNSHHYGIAGYYSLMALQHDLIGMSMTNAAPLVVPTFGRNAILGTNPISLTAPAEKEKAFVLDMATSVVPRGKDVLSGVLSGAATGLGVDVIKEKPNVGHFFMALDPAAFRPLGEFKRDMDRLARELKESPKAEGQSRIYVHGEKSYARMEKFQKEGIPLSGKVVEAMRQVGTEIGVPWLG
ncbi:Ldh family oxidoreductase [Candidatus Bathyarchaeota archaeon]|nr:MAG: Ldh family oxidoreductase [Candidatus Bathyarchaeota archaeon]